MKIETFLLCDAATDSNGKLNLLGAFDTIYTRETPVVHRACSIALRIRFLKIEEGQHKLKIDISDADGKSIIPHMTGDINVKMGDDVTSKSVNVILNIQGIKLEKTGEYQVDLAINNRHESSLPFYLRQLPKHGNPELN